MKKLIFVTQAKGGAGKSVLTFLLAEMHKNAVVFDMDDATKTTSTQLAYRKPHLISFLNSNNVIDRGLFDDFLEKIADSKNDFFICDLGASISEQLPYYLKNNIDFLPGLLNELKIDLEIFTVVGGANIFKATMSYLEDIKQAVGENFKLSAFRNDYFELSNDQLDALKDFTTKYKSISVVPFNISRDKNESTQNRIREVLKSGKGIEAAPAFSKMYFQTALKELSEALNSQEVIEE